MHSNRYRFVILSLAILVRSCIGLIWASAGPLLPLIMGEYGISRGNAAWFASVAPITIAVFAIPLGIILSRYSLKKTFALGAVLQAAGLLAPLVDTYSWLLLTRVLFAVGTAITVPVATAIASEWFSYNELPAINGVTMSFVNMGNAVAFMATVPLATAFFWKAPIVAYGAFALTCAVSWIVFGKDRKALFAVPSRLAGAGPGKGPLNGRQPARELTVKQALTQRSTVLLSIAVFGNWSLGNMIGSWLPTYYNEVFDMPLGSASSMMALVTVAGTAACLFGGIVGTRVGLRRPFIIIPGVFMGMSAVAALLFDNTAWIILSVAAFGFFANLQTPTLFTIPMELPDISPRTGVLVISAMQCAGNLGNFVGPLLVGYLADATGSYLPGFIIGAVFSFGLLVAGLLLPETGPAAHAHPHPLAG